MWLNMRRTTELRSQYWRDQRSVNCALSLEVLCIANILFLCILQEIWFATRRTVFSVICPSRNCVLIIQLECEYEVVASYCCILQNGTTWLFCWQTSSYERCCLFNPSTPELNPFAHRCLTIFFTGDFGYWTVHFVNICVKNQQMQQLFIQFINYVW
jgi:hypothetical protein